MDDYRSEPSVQVTYEPAAVQELIRADMKRRFNIEPTDDAMSFSEGTRVWKIEVSLLYLRKQVDDA